jgi:hypothetical protein
MMAGSGGPVNLDFSSAASVGANQFLCVKGMAPQERRPTTHGSVGRRSCGAGHV